MLLNERHDRNKHERMNKLLSLKHLNERMKICYFPTNYMYSNFQGKIQFAKMLSVHNTSLYQNKIVKGALQNILWYPWSSSHGASDLFLGWQMCIMKYKLQYESLMLNKDTPHLCYFSM